MASNFFLMKRAKAEKKNQHKEKIKIDLIYGSNTQFHSDQRNIRKWIS